MPNRSILHYLIQAHEYSIRKRTSFADLVTGLNTHYTDQRRTQFTPQEVQASLDALEDAKFVYSRKGEYSLTFDGMDLYFNVVDERAKQSVHVFLMGLYAQFAKSNTAHFTVSEVTYMLNAKSSALTDGLLEYLCLRGYVDYFRGKGEVRPTDKGMLLVSILKG